MPTTAFKIYLIVFVSVFGNIRSLGAPGSYLPIPIYTFYYITSQNDFQKQRQLSSSRFRMVREYGGLFTLSYHSDCRITGRLPNLEIAIFSTHKILILQCLTCRKLTFLDGMQNAEFLDLP